MVVVWNQFAHLNLSFLFVDVAASTTHYAGFYGYRGTITVWIREAMNAGNYIYAISSLVEGAAHAALFATLFQLSKGVLDTSLAPESSDGCFMRPAGTMVRNVAITVLALLTAAIFGVEIAYVVEMSRLWDIAKDAIYGDLDSLFSLINMDSQSDPGLARDLNLIARQLQAALQCAFLAVALGVVVGAGLVWKRSRAESPVHKSRKVSQTESKRRPPLLICRRLTLLVPAFDLGSRCLPPLAHAERVDGGSEDVHHRHHVENPRRKFGLALCHYRRHLELRPDVLCVYDMLRALDQGEEQVRGRSEGRGYADGSTDDVRADAATPCV